MTRGPDPRLVSSAAHVFVADLDHPVLAHEDQHHLVRVLRLRDGEPVTAGDGDGRWRPCRFAAGGTLVTDGGVVVQPAPPYELAIAFVPPKGDRTEWIVQKLTELGADRIIPMESDRSIVRWDAARKVKQATRLARIVREAAMQSRRVRLPVLEPLTSFAAVAERPGAALAVPGADPFDGDARLVLIGPEGGWSEDELRRPLSRVGLGETVLRAETAAIVTCALGVSARADLVGE